MTRTLDLTDPATGEVFGTSPIAEQSEVDMALESAAQAFAIWRRSTPAQRQLALLKIADTLEARASEFADLEVRETGKIRSVVLDEEIPECVSALRFFAGAARHLEGTAAGEYTPGHTSVIRREPVGVCAQIAPWNYPLMMAVWKIAPALAAGNTVVLKPAETTPSTAVLLARIAAEFLPPGAFTVLTGDRDTGRALVRHPATDLVSITGSTRAGIDVATVAAADLKRTHLELGGNAPLLVFPDADLAEAVEGIVGAAFYNAGQDCTAGSRVLVHESIHDDFVASLAKAASAQTPGVDYGPLNSAAQFSRVEDLIARLPSHARIETGGTRYSSRGFYFSPTVISGVRQDDEIVQEEIFGPVITVQSFSDEAAAVALANDVPYGLASSVWTKDLAVAARVTAELNFGCVWVNTHGPLVAEMPHGGFAHSGHGKDLSTYAFTEYTRVKHVMTRFA
ncbi:betaine-aldehyde dehydrogenase [Amycolatopsis mediterranei S699]|uniref:Betaine-aldehyde dehydrogenase n=3 Tax=Amycolatopsis mediterranei TaxID=33910 RepID=A0A0H3D1B2_AMYMU|nr:gamma-aminobutyraldehyde dehydrogenase [Amycolatopsis mediterranei]ADJ44415.1 betaine-aldehyde dehydrogenase [Amycolatopsis mediterranei U32]AEK41153.1 betaine-aldehyde dehydrogenase [Amycolatopsis mediterranei S699]AFO76128.1 betaine-aldehyde dehydrogenase [Amycolatopsis mediterranei S699]AGT83257.1 betaine-aldehyde dehydrogenase [Amycolatopsis mediterranei RB]KDO06667.1 phenylacetaldehyde dehydrogenase [Amycolatopsis mediterranei]